MTVLLLFNSVQYNQRQAEMSMTELIQTVQNHKECKRHSIVIVRTVSLLLINLSSWSEIAR